MWNCCEQRIRLQHNFTCWSTQVLKAFIFSSVSSASILSGLTLYCARCWPPTRVSQHAYGPIACSVQNTFHCIVGLYESPTVKWNYCQKAFAVMILSSILADHLCCFSFTGLRCSGIRITRSVVYQHVNTQIYSTMCNSLHFGKEWTKSHEAQRRGTRV